MKSIDHNTKKRFTPSHYNFHSNIVIKVHGKRYELKSGHGSDDWVSVFISR